MKRTEIRNRVFKAALLIHIAADELRQLYGELPAGEGEIAVVASAAGKLEQVKDSIANTFNINRKHIEGRR